MAKKKKEQLAWELRLLAMPETMFSIEHDEEVSFSPLEELGIDTDGYVTLWIEVPDQPDFGGRSRDAQSWLDNNAPISGQYRLKRLVDEKLATVQMVRTINTRAVQASLDLDERASKAAGRAVQKMADEARENLESEGEDAAKPKDTSTSGSGELPLDEPAAKGGGEPLPKVGDRTTLEDGAVAECVEVDEETGHVGWAVVDEQPKLRSVPSAEGDEPAPPKKKKAEKAEPRGTREIALAEAERQAWNAAPLRTCRSLQTCCICEDSIVSSQRYRDRGYGKRAHEQCLESLS